MIRLAIVFVAGCLLVGAARDDVFELNEKARAALEAGLMARQHPGSTILDVTVDGRPPIRALLRDLQRLTDLEGRLAVSPLGAGAGGGSRLPLDPAAAAAAGPVRSTASSASAACACASSHTPARSPV